ncbi:MAG: CHASE domain-containing protein [Gammaproteobacteria bacterium]
MLQDFQDAASDRVLMIQRELDLTLGLVQDIGSFFEASQWVGRREFRKYVGPALKRYDSIVALEWIPRVTNAGRSAFVADARRSFPRFRITERNPDGELIDAGQRTVYYPVLFVQPYQHHREALGLDLASDPAILDALRRTRDAGQMLVSSRTRIEQDGSEDYGFVARLPVYKHGKPEEGALVEDEDAPPETLEQRRQLLRGFVSGTFRIGAIVEGGLENLRPVGIDIVLYEVSGEGERTYLYRHESRRRSAGDAGKPVNRKPPADREYLQILEVRNRTWEVACTPIPGYFQPVPWRGWTVLAGGWAFTLLLVMYFSTLVGRTAKVKRLVTERTLQLVKVNESLNREISERRKAEKELQALNETLEQRVAVRTAEAEQHVRELEQFAYVTSHDLKAPLRGIANLAAWLQEDLKGKLADENREQLKLLQDRVQRMHALIEGLLEYSRIGRTERSFEDVDCAELLAEVVDSLSPPPGVVIDIARDMPVLHTGRLQLFQVFSNLIGNAVRHRNTAQGRVRVTVADLGDYFQFTVADDGPGIAAEYHDKVFMIFQTLEAADYGGSTGIGLALVKKIVEEHGGSITLESAEGKGAVFRFTWPRQE